METLLAFVISVAANVVSTYICKWLDERSKQGIRPQ